jgi:hypothetical protein
MKLCELRAFAKLKSQLKSGGLAKEQFGTVWQGLYFCTARLTQVCGIRTRWSSRTNSQLRLPSSNVPAELYFEWCKFGFIVLKRHWNELDFYRINKFLYLVRLLLVACFKKIEARGFKKSVRESKGDLH